MKHARTDYDRIQDPSGKIPDDEPVFLLRGQDKHAAAAVRMYAALVEAASGDRQIIEACRRQADRMDAWRPKQTPDMIPGTIR